MPSSMESVALSRPASFIGGVAVRGGVAYAAIIDLQQGATELIAIERRGDPGRLLAVLPLDGISGLAACGEELLIAGSFPDGQLGAVTVAADGKDRARRDLGSELAAPPIPLCIGGRAVLVWSAAATRTRVLATAVDDGSQWTVVEDPEPIQIAAAAGAGGPAALVRYSGGLRALVAGGPPRAVIDAAVDMPVLCSAADGLVAAWSEQYRRTIRARRLSRDGQPTGDPLEVAAAPVGEELGSIHLACDVGGRLAVLWQSASVITDPSPGARTATRLWVSFIDGNVAWPAIELTEGGPGAAAWRGTELVVVHGEGTPRISTLRGAR